jgi:hypothetical protein
VTLSFSRSLALFVGIVTLFAEVARRRQQMLDPAAVLLWIDDILLAAFLLYGAWRVARDRQRGRPVLAAAWGFMSGMAFYSFFEQLHHLAAPDPSGLAPLWVVAVKCVALVLGVVGMVAALRTRESSRSAAAGRDSAVL